MLYDLMLSFFGTMESIWNLILSVDRTDVGYISTFFLAICSFPLLMKTINDKHCKGVSGWFILCWWLGDATGLVYLYDTQQMPLLLNYGLNSIMATSMLIYKIRKG